ncbi:interleukin-18 isoform X2 [Pseudophryne corroboree]|uniref:interleukin-18 isoform X2 n=1 Tax=Pseudophryne corroboree TaxID=495146 RepID=UPI003081B47E
MGMLEIDFDICHIQDEVLYFSCVYQADSWKKASSCCIKGTIENYFKECLEAHPEGPSGSKAVFANPSDPDRRNFELQAYRTNIIYDGLSVAFTVTVNNEQYCLCCSEEMELFFKKENCPDTIIGEKSGIIFFQKQFSEGNESFKFEASLLKNYYLAVSEDNGKRKLVLKKNYDEVDETQMFDIN